MSSYAIIQTGGKQYRVAPDDVIDIELLDVEPGAQVEFSVLFLQNGDSSQVGTPTVSGCVVKGEYLGIELGPKVTSVKYKQRKRQRIKWGHRQKYSRIKITEIGGKASETKPKTKAAKAA